MAHIHLCVVLAWAWSSCIRNENYGQPLESFGSKPKGPQCTSSCCCLPPNYSALLHAVAVETASRHCLVAFLRSKATGCPCAREVPESYRSLQDNPGLERPKQAQNDHRCLKMATNCPITHGNGPQVTNTTFRHASNADDLNTATSWAGWTRMHSLPRVFCVRNPFG